MYPDFLGAIHPAQKLGCTPVGIKYYGSEMSEVRCDEWMLENKTTTDCVGGRYRGSMSLLPAPPTAIACVAVRTAPIPAGIASPIRVRAIPRPTPCRVRVAPPVRVGSEAGVVVAV